MYGTPPGPESLSAASESLPAGFESLLASLESPSAGFENLSAGFESVSAGFESPHTDIGSQFAGPKGLPSIPESLYGGFKSLPAGLDSEQLSIMVTSPSKFLTFALITSRKCMRSSTNTMRLYPTC